MKLYLEPSFSAEDKADGGIRRVVEAQRRLLPLHGVELVEQPQNAEIIATHIAPQKPTWRLLNANPDIPWANHLHGAYWAEYQWDNWCHKANADLMEAVRQADVTTVPSEWVAQVFRRNSLRLVEVIGHGVDLEEWPLQSGHKGFVLWSKTRVDDVCDPDALNHLAEMAPDVQFVTTHGDKRLANVDITGPLPYGQAKCLVHDAAIYLCTTRETFGIGTLEAMACGKPVLGWRWGGQVDIVEHGVSGWLAAPGDFNGLLEGLRYCLEHKEKMGQAGRQTIEENYQWKDRIDAYADLYKRLAEDAKVKRPKVSVVVPAHGLEALLPDALDSVKQQTMGDWECIVVDDASPDRCGEIAERYADADTRFRVIHNKENQYLAGALNTGIDAAKSRYVIPLDADNMLKSGALEVLSNALDSDRSTAIAYGNVEFLEPDGKRWNSGWPMAFRADWQLNRRNLVPSTSMFRKTAWELTGGYRRRWRTAEDADFWTRATSYGFRARMVTEADTFVYRNRPESMSRVEEQIDWTSWYPWCNFVGAIPPAAIIADEQPPIPTYEPHLVSVVIPVGPGHEELVIDALDSVDGQTFRLWECIVVNDTGKPLRWLPSWATEIRTPGLLGVAAARNIGIKKAQGKVFLPLDADDTLQPQALAEMYAAWEEFGGYVYSNWFERWPDKEQIWEAPDYDLSRIQYMLTEHGCLHLVTALYPKAAWEEVGGFDQKLPAWEDWDFQLKLADIGCCGSRIPLPLLTYRKDTGTRSGRNWAKGPGTPEFEKAKEPIVEKWRDVFEGRRKLMACGGCPGGGGRRVQPRLAQQVTPRDIPSVPVDGQFALVEYIGHKTGPTVFRGPSGTKYRFAAIESDKVKLVRADDAKWFAGFNEFRIREPEKPVAVA